MHPPGDPLLFVRSQEEGEGVTLAIVIAATAAATNYSGELFTLGGIVLVAVLGWVGSVIAKRLRAPTPIETLWSQVDGLSKEIYGDEEAKTIGLKRRLENSERRDQTKGRIIRDLAGQWPSNHVPRLNPYDLEDLEENTIPTHWKVKP